MGQSKALNSSKSWGHQSRIATYHSILTFVHASSRSFLFTVVSCVLLKCPLREHVSPRRSCFHTVKDVYPARGIGFFLSRVRFPLRNVSKCIVATSSLPLRSAYNNCKNNSIQYGQYALYSGRQPCVFGTFPYSKNLRVSPFPFYFVY